MYFINLELIVHSFHVIRIFLEQMENIVMTNDFSINLNYNQSMFISSCGDASVLKYPYLSIFDRLLFEDQKKYPKDLI